MIRSLATSPDAQFAVVRIGREVSLLASGAGPALAKIELDSDDVDLTLVGPPTGLLAVSRSDAGHKIVLYQPPYLEAVARQDLEIPARLVATTGPRIVVISADAMHAMVVRASNRALATQKVEVAGPIEFVVGLERNQLLFGLHKKLEVWDAVSGRPLLRPNFQLPPSPRVLGPAHGHMWAMRTGSEEVFVYRLSDGRPFRHHAGAPILEVICHPASPLIVLRTERSLYRLHCFSHSMSTIDHLPGEATAFALLAVGDDVTLLGLPEDGTEPWRMVLSGGGAPMITMQLDTAEPPSSPPAPRPAEVSESISPPAAAPVVETRAGGKAWRQQLAALGAELARGGEAELPVVAIDNALGDLAHRLQLSSAARRTLIALYALHLVGEPSLPIAKLAAVVNDWPEALGQGDLGQLAMLRTKHGRVSLRRAVTDLLDGVPPRSIRIVGGGPTTPRAGVWRTARDGRPDVEIEPALAEQLGRIAVVEGPLARAVLEARLHGATAVATSVPTERPRPWPRDAGLVFVLYGTSSSWVADVPALT
jgi:hypothetical protein